MFSEVDDSLRALLVADVPIDPAAVDISFDRPTREWSNRLTRPTVNLFLSDIRERTELRSQQIQVRPSPDGTALLGRGERRIDLTYTVTAWANDPGDEHRILAAVLACMFRTGEVAEEHLQGGLAAAEHPLTMRIMPPDHHITAADLWSVLDNEIHASLTWVATAPLDAFAPITAPLVRTAEIGYAAVGDDWRESITRVAGVVRGSGEGNPPLVGARVEILGTAFSAVTDRDGRFSFSGVRPNGYTWRVSVDGREHEVDMAIPSDDYIITI